MEQHTTLEKALMGAFRDIDLLNDGNETWMVCNLLDAIREGEAINQELGVAPGVTLQSEVYVDESGIYALNDDGYFDPSLPLYTPVVPPVDPYRVISTRGGYRVVFMEDEDQGRYRSVDGKSFYEHKQAAYRRKDSLNAYWRENGFAAEAITSSAEK